MGHITFKRMNAGYKNTPAIRHLLRYAIYEKGYEKKFRYWGARNLSKDVEKASREIITMQRLLGKNEGRLMHHFIISFPLEIQDVQVVYVLAEVLADYLGQEYQLFYGVHTDEPNLHIHLVMNSVSFKTGLKWTKGKSEFMEWGDNIKRMLEELLNEYYCFSK